DRAALLLRISFPGSLCTLRRLPGKEIRSRRAARSVEDIGHWVWLNGNIAEGPASTGPSLFFHILIEQQNRITMPD
ncbi:hypothetical protein, partial [Eisenbergiella tayi]